MQPKEYSSITIRKLPAELKQALRFQAARHGHSMEEEVRQILQNTIMAATKPKNAYELLRAPFEGLDLPESLDIPARGQGREPIDFS